MSSFLKLIAGIDEAGRGPLAGPVVSAAVILRPNARIPGLKDSKLLSARMREKLFELIIKNSVDYAITIVSHKLIDEINISNATRFANYLCLHYMKTVPDIALVDGIDKQFFEIPYENIIKGDQKVRVISAASVLAKVTRDRIMRYYSKEFRGYGFEYHVGYGTRKHISNIKKYGLCEIHRKSYNIRPCVFEKI
ncbi:MAG: ribonuclease HII [Candidatus Peregrinibacteria bacterium]